MTHHRRLPSSLVFNENLATRVAWRGGGPLQSTARDPRRGNADGRDHACACHHGRLLGSRGGGVGGAESASPPPRRVGNPVNCIGNSFP